MQIWKPLPAGNLAIQPSAVNRPPPAAWPPGLLEDAAGNQFLPLSPSLRSLLDLPHAGIRIGAAPRPRPPRSPGPDGIDTNIPPHARGYLQESVAALLQRYVAAARDEPLGSPRPSDRLAGDMLHALRLAPERRADFASLRYAYYVIERYVSRLKFVVGEALRQAPQYSREITEIAHATLPRAQQVALALPVPAGGEVGLDHQREQALHALLPSPERLLRSARERAEETALAEAGQAADRFFRGPAAGLLRGGGADATADELDGLIGGAVVITAADEDGLREVLRHVPPGRLVANQLLGVVSNYIKLGPATFHVRYPPRGWRRTLHTISWQHGGATTPVLVALRGTPQRPHYSLDEGRHWRPTGAPHLPALTAALAERWSLYLQGRLAQHTATVRRLNTGHGGRRRRD